MVDKHDKYGPGGSNSPDPYVPDHEKNDREGPGPETEGTPLREAIIELRERNPDMTQRQIAESAGCSEQYVSDVLTDHRSIGTASTEESPTFDSEVGDNTT